MKQYPTISKEIVKGEYTYLFDKLDGSNIRGLWTKKKGFNRFGSRTELIDKTHLLLGKAPELVLEKYNEDLSRRLYKERVDQALCFFEFYGPSSFAGNHDLVNETQTVTLIEISLHPKGIIKPKEFLKLADGLDHAKLLYEGFLNQEVIESVRNGTLPNMTFEGVIGKTNSGTPGLPNMFKIKNVNWLKKLKEFCKGDEALFNKLS